MPNEYVDRIIESLDISDSEKIAKRNALLEDIEIPVKFIGIGQTGVGKTELLRSIFRLDNRDETILENLESGSAKATTKDFFSFVIENEQGLKLQLTDGPGLGEDAALEKKYIEMWCEEIPKHDLLYWVLDGPSRDIAHIQETMKIILDRTGFHNRVVVALNKVDNFALVESYRDDGDLTWDIDLNIPTDKLEEVIKQRTDDIVEKLSAYSGVSRDRIIPCSALKRWNHEKVLDALIEAVPEEMRYKVSVNRDVKDFSELMTDAGRSEIHKMLSEVGK